MSAQPLYALPQESAAAKPTPLPPQSIDETGLPASVIEQLMLKILYFRGDVLGRELASSTGLRFSIIESILETLKLQRIVTVKKSLGMGSISSVFCLTEQGRQVTEGYLETNQYTGPAPVPIELYAEIVRLQRLKENWLTLDMLREAYSHMVVTPELLASIGPAVSSGKSFLIYGQPGNGKSFLAEALFNLQTDPVYVPYAIYCQGMIIQMYDPVYHQKIDEKEDPLSALSFEAPYDRRWLRCRRPFIITGGELTMHMLDLNYNATAGVYDAPFQLKANNGIYLIDDFGRQKASPAEILNRWIVPMERRIDYLTFQTGGKTSVPFETFLVFSTNLEPHHLGDEAFLRRIQYKMFLRNPGTEEFRAIFTRYCQSQKLPFAPSLLDTFISRYYTETNKKFRRCQPRDLITHAIDLIRFEGRPWELTLDVLDRAWGTCFVQELAEDN
jgi:hypothetical protein